MTRRDIRHLDCHTRKRLIVDLAKAGISPRDIGKVLEMSQRGISSELSRLGLSGRINKRFRMVLG